MFPPGIGRQPKAPCLCHPDRALVPAGALVPAAAAAGALVSCAKAGRPRNRVAIARKARVFLCIVFDRGGWFIFMNLGYTACSPFSSVRMRIASSIFDIKTLPSPIFPVLAD